MRKLIRYTRHSSGGWEVWVSGRCLGTVVASGGGWDAFTKNGPPYRRGSAWKRYDAAALLPGFDEEMATARLDRLTRLCAELVNEDKQLSEYFHEDYQSSVDEDGDPDERHRAVLAIGHRILDLMGVRR